jgi:hypothetical protein
MSRAQVEAIVDALEAVTVTDAGLPGGSLSLSGLVHAEPPRDMDLPSGGIGFVWLVDSSLEFDGMLPKARALFSVYLVLPLADPSEAVACGAEVVRAIFLALKASSLGGLTNDWGLVGWQALVDQSTGLLRVAGQVQTGVYL